MDNKSKNTRGGGNTYYTYSRSWFIQPRPFLLIRPCERDDMEDHKGISVCFDRSEIVGFDSL